MFRLSSTFAVTGGSHVVAEAVDELARASRTGLLSRMPCRSPPRAEAATARQRRPPAPAGRTAPTDDRAGRGEVRHARLAVRARAPRRARPTPASPTRRSRSATATTPATRPRPVSTRRCRDAVKPMIAWCNDAGRHQRAQGRRQVLRREGAAGHAGHDPGVQRQGVHAGRSGLRARREPGDDSHRLQAVDDPRLRGRHRVRERLGHAAADPEPRRPRGSSRPRSRLRSCSPTR